MTKNNLKIQLSNIKKVYHIGNQEVIALAGINLKIYQNDFIALIVSSGSGKSTLMNIMGCLDRPTSGSYKLDNNEISTLTDDELAITRNEKIGFVFQNLNLLSRISALKNVELPLIYADINKKEREERAYHYLESVGLADRANHNPNELSGGQRQRVAIARALVSNPQIILADEPTGNLDTKSTKEIMKIFENMHNNGRTIILVTHEPDVANYAEKQFIVNDGSIKKYEGKDEIINVV